MSGKVAKRQRAAEAWGPWVDVHDAVLVARSGQAGETLINMVRAVRNQILSVQILAYSPHPDGMLYGHEVFHLMIRRHDGAPGIGWKEKQRIKDELMGPGWTAVEVFPPPGRSWSTAAISTTCGRSTGRPWASGCTVAGASNRSSSRCESLRPPAADGPPSGVFSAYDVSPHHHHRGGGMGCSTS